MPTVGISNTHYTGQLRSLISSDCYEFCRIRNYTSQDVYACDSSGRITRVPSQGRSDYGSTDVVVEYYRGDDGHDTTNCSISSDGLVKVNMINIQESVLNTGPVDLDAIGVRLCSERYQDQLVSSNPYTRAVDAKQQDRVIEEMLSKSGTIANIYWINTHDPEFKYAWAVIDGRVVPIAVLHDPNKPEIFRYIYRSVTGHYISDNVNLADIKDLSLCEVRDEDGDRTILFGTDKQKLLQHVAARENRINSCKTPEEVEAIVQQRLAEKQAELDQAQKVIEDLRTKLQNTKNDYDNTKKQLDAANSATAGSYEQQNLAMKFAIAQQEANNLAERNRQTIEQQEMALEASLKKAKADEAIQEAKVQKEQLSVATARASAVSTTAKIALATIPAVISVGALLMAGFGSNSLMPSAPKIVSKVASGAKHTLKSMADAAMDISKRAASAIYGAAKTAASWVKSGISTAVSWVKKGISAVGGAISGLWNAITS